MKDKIISVVAFGLDVLDPRRVFISNFFKKEYKKKVLIVYLTDPFCNGIRGGHTNSAENLVMARTFDELKYSVDVCRYNSKVLKLFIKRRTHYDVLIGIEPGFLDVINWIVASKKIYYATGSYWKFQNEAEQMRISDVWANKNVLLKPRRQIPPHKSAELADLVISIGNEATKRTYGHVCQRVYSLNVTGAKTKTVTRDWQNARNSFLWFGSAGLVHKGLDIVLEVFKNHSDKHLYICGGIKEEKDFMSAYREELSLPNVHIEGWINPNSERFKFLSRTCGFSVLLSCSEGMSSSLVTCMMAGMIPLATKECGVDLEDKYLVNKPYNKNFDKLVTKFSAMKPDILERLSKEVSLTSMNNFSLENYHRNLKRILTKVL